MDDNPRDVVVGLLDADPARRARAVAVAQNLAPEIGTRRIETLLRTRPHLYRGVPPSDWVRERDLEWGLLRALAAAVRPSDASALALLRSAVGDEQDGSSVLAGLTLNDSKWIVEHPDAWGASDPKRMAIVLHGLRDKQARERLLRTMLLVVMRG